MEMPKPTEAHAKLARMAGTWHGEEIMHPSPWAPEGSKAQSIVSAELRIDGFFLITDYEQRCGDTVTFKGHGVYGYDPASGKYTMHWFDSLGMDPGAPALGTWEGDTLTFENQSPMGHGRYRYTMNADGGYVFEMSHSMDGQNWAKMMDATYTRVE